MVNKTLAALPGACGGIPWHAGVALRDVGRVCDPPGSGQSYLGPTMAMQVLDGKPYRLPDGTWGAVIGDVLGRGLPAAGDLVWLYTRKSGIWQVRVVEVLGRHETWTICRTETVRGSP